MLNLKYELACLRSSFTVYDLLVSIALMVILGLTFARGALVSNNDVALRTLRAEFTNVEVTDRAWFLVGLRGCSTSDAVRYTATVTNAQGKNVELYVCSGAFFKAGTVRVP